MKTTFLDIPDLVLIEPRVYEDERGFFYESFNQAKFEHVIGRQVRFVQDNHSKSTKSVLRGLHYQIQQPQGKLVRVVHGEVYDVAVDIRKSSKTFGRWVGVRLSAKNKRQLWVPEGFAHGYLVLSEIAEFEYKVTDYYAPAYERTIIWNDSFLNKKWPVCEEPVLSDKDRQGSSFEDADAFLS